MEEKGIKSKYGILYSVRTGISICKKKGECQPQILRFNIKDHSVFVKDYKFIRSGKTFDFGLEFIIEIESDDIESTLSLLKNEVEMILNLFCFSTRCYAGSATLESIIKNNSSEIGDATFYSYPTTDQSIKQIGLIDLKFFSDVWENYNKCENDEKQRILRSISWLRKGLNDEKFDEFISNWIGLEILSKMIRKQYIGVVDKNDEWSGLKKIFNDFLHINKTQFEHIKDNYRNGIIHGFRELDDSFVRDVERSIPDLRKGLIACICKSLKLPDKTIQNVLELEIKKWHDPHQILTAKINNLPDFEQQKMEFPRCFPFIKELTFDILDGNKLNYNVEMEFTFRIPKRASVSTENLETWGNSNSGIENIETEIK
jgi:hypothetical protein